MNDAALASIAALHYVSPPDYFHPFPVCMACEDVDIPWPCATRKLADEGLAADAATLDRLRTIVGEPSTGTHYCWATRKLDVLRAALADLDAKVKETK